ncbi:putative small hydrophilic protein [Streptomyces sp. W007]|nr:putative small hydrophilic protein [Streptomyces sp. W007]
MMSGSDEPADLARQMREKAQQLAEAAKRTSDPHERERLEKKSRTIRDRSEQQSAMEAGDIYPEK